MKIIILKFGKKFLFLVRTWLSPWWPLIDLSTKQLKVKRVHLVIFTHVRENRGLSVQMCIYYWKHSSCTLWGACRRQDVMFITGHTIACSVHTWANHAVCRLSNITLVGWSVFNAEICSAWWSSRLQWIYENCNKKLEKVEERNQTEKHRGRMHCDHICRIPGFLLWKKKLLHI